MIKIIESNIAVQLEMQLAVQMDDNSSKGKPYCIKSRCINSRKCLLMKMEIIGGIQ